MSLYNILFGKNSQSALLLAVVGLRECDVERFRDVSASDDGSTISVYSRTGGGNRSDYPNTLMRHLSGWNGSEDDDFDSTYATDTFTVPERWRKDVVALGDPLAHGLRRAFARHLSRTLRREPTENDKAATLYENERAALARTRHSMANGHTFVPHDDAALLVALKLAEANGGKLRSCWGIAPITIIVKRDFQNYPNHKDPKERETRTRVEVNYDYQWTMDLAYWDHMQRRFAADFPLTFANIRNDVEAHCAKQAARP